MHQHKLAAIVFRMAANAARLRLRHEDRVKTTLLLQARRDFLVTLKTTERWRARGDRVAAHATGGAVHFLMCFRKRTGR